MKFILVAALIWSSYAFGQTHSDESILEIQNAMMDPDTALADLVRKNQILFIGNPNHYNHGTYERIIKLIKNIGLKENLRYLVLERHFDHAPFYQALATLPLDLAIDEIPFATRSSARNTLCASPEWSYSIQNFFPEIQKINVSRSMKERLIVTSIDGLASDQGIDLDHSIQTLPRDCSFAKAQGVLVKSANREMGTARNFLSFLKSMKPGQKAIVMYHWGHLLRGFKSCMPVKRGETWFSEIQPLTWIDRVMEKYPELSKKAAFAFIDEECSLGGGIVTLPPSFKLVQDILPSIRNQSVAIDLNKVNRSQWNEKGLDIFTANSLFKSYLEGQHASANQIQDLADLLLWNHDGPKESLNLVDPSAYLPNQCSKTAFSPIRTLRRNGEFANVGYGELGLAGSKIPLCTFTILRHGLMITAKHCFQHLEVFGLKVDPSKLTVTFPNGIAISKLNVRYDSGDNDIAYVEYEPNLTASIQIPKIVLSNQLPGPDDLLYVPGYPVAADNSRPIAISRFCSTTGKTGFLTKKPKDPGYGGKLAEIDCPAWWGQSGSPVFGITKHRKKRTLVLHGVLAHTFLVEDDGSVDQKEIVLDDFGKYVPKSNFSPISLRKDQMN